jgi:PAS domain S-box-containing protein
LTVSDSLHSPVLRELIDCIDDIVLILDSGLHIVIANRAAAVSFGYSVREISMKHFFPLLKPEKRKEMGKFIRGTKERRGGEAVFLKRSFKEISLRFSLSPLGNVGGKPWGYLLVGRSKAEEDPVRIADYLSNGLVERMLKGSADPLFIVDGTSRTVLDCNQTALAVFGFTREELVGWRLLSHAVSEKERERNEALMARADKAYAKTGIFQERLLFPRKNGPALPCEFLGLPFFNSDGSVAFIIAMLFDRSSEEDREAELANILNRVNDLAADLAAAAKHSTDGETTRLSALGFTPRQIEIARLVAMGASSKDIGFRLGIAESTVRNHLSVMFRKLGVASRVSFMHVLTEQRIRIA